MHVTCTICHYDTVTYHLLSCASIEENSNPCQYNLLSKELIYSHFTIASITFTNHSTIE